MHTIGLSRAWRLESRTSHSLVVVRQFNSPTGLQPEQQVWIALKPQRGCCLLRVELNGLALPGQHDASGGLASRDDYHRSDLDRWSIPSLLPSNLLSIEITVPESSPWQSTEPAKRLLDVSLWFAAELQID